MYKIIKYKVFYIVIFIALMNTFFLIKKPLYNDIQTFDLINFINENIENNKLIQTDLSIHKKIFILGPIIRILTNQNIYFDNSFPFNLRVFKEWKIRSEKIQQIKSQFKNSNFKLALCNLTKLNIDYYVSTTFYKDKFIVDNIAFKNDKYILIKTIC